MGGEGAAHGCTQGARSVGARKVGQGRATGREGQCAGWGEVGLPWIVGFLRGGRKAGVQRTRGVWSVGWHRGSGASVYERVWSCGRGGLWCAGCKRCTAGCRCRIGGLGTLGVAVLHRGGCWERFVRQHAGTCSTAPHPMGSTHLNPTHHPVLLPCPPMPRPCHAIHHPCWGTIQPQPQHPSGDPERHLQGPWR